MEVIRIILKSGHVEKLRAKFWKVEKDQLGRLFNIIPVDPIGRQCHCLDMDEVVAVTVEEVAVSPAEAQPPGDGRREDRSDR